MDDMKNKKPNIVFILADDLGYGDFSIQHVSKDQSKNLAELPLDHEENPQPERSVAEKVNKMISFHPQKMAHNHLGDCFPSGSAIIFCECLFLSHFFTVLNFLWLM